ncbi:MAG: DUF4349 domain-containing protein [Lachnospiraceae bacterium]|nr:DUF4349 domain-containing protein [Lachnospiraceae bacterium]
MKERKIRDKRRKNVCRIPGFSKRNALISLSLICLLGTLLTACGASSLSSTTTADMAAQEVEVYYEEAAEAEAAYEEAGVNTYSLAEDTTIESPSGENTRTDRKMIRTVDMNVETENYDQLMEEIEARVNELGGYIEFKEAYHGNQYNVGNRSASLQVRIPADRMDEFTGKVKEAANVVRESESVEDVTLTYVDLESHKKMLVAEQERLLELLEEAQSIEDIIALESRLSEVRYQIESMEAQLRTYDNLVDYSTINLYIQEVERYTPEPQEGALDRIKSGFSENVYRVGNGIWNFIIEFIIAIPLLVVWAIIVLIIVLLVLRIRNSQEKRKERKAKIRREKENERK